MRLLDGREFVFLRLDLYFFFIFLNEVAPVSLLGRNKTLIAVALHTHLFSKKTCRENKSKSLLSN